MYKEGSPTFFGDFFVQTGWWFDEKATPPY